MSDFSDNIVNQQFRKVYEYLDHTNQIKGKSDIAKQLGTYNHVINSILKGKRNITVDQLSKLFETYNIDANYLFGRTDQMQDGEHQSDVPAFSMSKMSSQRRNITLVPQQALAGYALGVNDTSYVEDLRRFSIPGFDGELTAFEISGDSMMPTITNGDVVVCEVLERGEPLRDNSVYVVVTDVVVAKRIQQKKSGNGNVELRLISDNEMYKPYSVELNEIQKIFRVKCRLTSHGVN